MKRKEEAGRRIKALRNAKGLSQPELAELCGWPGRQVRISQYECGKRSPEPENYETLAKALDTTPEYLMFGINAETIPSEPADNSQLARYATACEQLRNLIEGYCIGSGDDRLLQKANEILADLN